MEILERPYGLNAGYIWHERYKGFGIYAMPGGPRRVPDWHLEDGRLGRMRILGRLRDRNWVPQTAIPCRGYVLLEYGISGEGELRWTLGMTVKRSLSRHTVSLSQQSYI